MTRQISSLSVVAGFGILGLCAWGILAALGSDAAVVRGVSLGALLGIAAAAAEVLVIRRALERDLNAALRIVLGGFGFRLLVVVAGTLALRATGFADGAAFALSFVAGFLAYLPVLASLSTGRVRNGGAAS